MSHCPIFMKNLPVILMISGKFGHLLLLQPDIRITFLIVAVKLCSAAGAAVSAGVDLVRTECRYADKWGNE